MKNIWKYMKEFVAEEDAVGVVEIILIGSSDQSGCHL